MKKFMFAALAAMVLVSCGGADAQKDSAKDSAKADSTVKA